MQTESEQPIEPEHIIHHAPRVWLIVLVSALVTAIVVGGGMWWMNGGSKEIQSNITEDKTVAYNHIFNPFDSKIGDKVADMIIASIGTFSEKLGEEITQDNLKVVFNGATEISGSYSYFGGEIGLDLDCFTPDYESTLRLPVFISDSAPFFCFIDSDPLLLKQIRDSKHATILIDKYTIIEYPAEVIDSAKLISVVDIEKKEVSTVDWKTYRNEDMGVEFKYPQEKLINASKESERHFSGPIDIPVYRIVLTTEATGEIEAERFSDNSDKVVVTIYQSLDDINSLEDHSFVKLVDYVKSGFVGNPASVKEFIVDGEKAYSIESLNLNETTYLVELNGRIIRLIGDSYFNSQELMKQIFLSLKSLY